MVDIKDIRESVEIKDKFMMDKQAEHVSIIENSISKLQKHIINDIKRLSTTKDGKLKGIRVNLKNAQKIHRKIEESFFEDFSKETKEMVKEFETISAAVEKSYLDLEIATEFSNIDQNAMDTLRDGIWRQFDEISGTKKQAIIQNVYDLVIGGGTFDDLVVSIQSALEGTIAPGAVGRSLLGESRLLARDSVMIYQQEVNNLIADKVGLGHYLYIGDIIATTREFCKQRAGKMYTRDQIDSWKYKWAGKSGPAFTHRGGYNCRHHWQAIRPEWMEGKKKLDIGNWDLEQRERG